MMEPQSVMVLQAMPTILGLAGWLFAANRAVGMLCLGVALGSSLSRLIARLLAGA